VAVTVPSAVPWLILAVGLAIVAFQNKVVRGLLSQRGAIGSPRTNRAVVNIVGIGWVVIGALLVLGLIGD
jgi:hypothetical protein